MSKLRLFLYIFVAFLILAAAMTVTAAGELKVVYNLGVAPLMFEDSASRPAGRRRWCICSVNRPWEPA